MITIEDFKDWKTQPVTKAVFAAINESIEGLKEELGAGAGIDPLSDRHKVGAIAAFRDVLNTEFGEVPND